MAFFFDSILWRFFLDLLQTHSRSQNLRCHNLKTSAGDLANLKEEVQKSFSLHICGVIDIRRFQSSKKWGWEHGRWDQLWQEHKVHILWNKPWERSFLLESANSSTLLFAVRNKTCQSRTFFFRTQDSSLEKKAVASQLQDDLQSSSSPRDFHQGCQWGIYHNRSSFHSSTCCLPSGRSSRG